jgi:hypothetical protein
MSRIRPTPEKRRRTATIMTAKVLSIMSGFNHNAAELYTAERISSAGQEGENRGSGAEKQTKKRAALGCPPGKMAKAIRIFR